MNRAPQSVWHFLLNAKVKQFFNIQKKTEEFFTKQYQKTCLTKHFDISTLQTAVGSRQSRSLGFRKISRHIYMVWFFFYNFAAK